MRDLLGQKINENIRGIVYLCEYDNFKLIPYKALHFRNAFDAIEAYANTPNPPSQIARGNSKEKFQKEVELLHRNMKNIEWQKELSEYLSNYG